MGKNGKFGKDYGKVVGKDSKGRPGWKGPGYIKKAEPKAKPAPADRSDAISEPLLPVDLQQTLLNIFRDTFPQVLNSDTLQPLLQSVKSALYERDFTRAFGSEEYLEAYSIRWSPSRALCYANVLIDLRKRLAAINVEADVNAAVGKGGGAHSNNTLFSLPAICFGGGAAEVVAFGGFLRYLQDSSSLESDDDEDNEDVAQKLSSLSISTSRSKIDLVLVDTATWKTVTDKLHQGLETPPPISKYASASAREANLPLLPPGTIETTFRCEDVLQLSQSELFNVIGKKPTLLTLLFTLNELYTSSIAKTTAFLLKLTMAAKPGTLLLVVDSPGSYSETTVGTEAKKYPMKWLLDHTLLETEKSRGEESRASWEKVVSKDSEWFRIPESLRYTIPLENMRYQIHLYGRQ
jgi:25S rRNA (uracil2843-N3)-methyltransferase